MEESWTIKRTECRRIDAFELWCWRRLLRVPWTVRSNQLILKEINPEYSLEGLRLKLKTPILWPPDAKNWLIRKYPDSGKDWKQEETGTTEDEMAGWPHWHPACSLTELELELEQALWDGEEQESLVCCSPWIHRVRQDWLTEAQGSGLSLWKVYGFIVLLWKLKYYKSCRSEPQLSHL